MKRGFLVAGVDCSTQATKIVVVDAADGSLVGSGRVNHDVVREGSMSETDPEVWWRALGDALKQTAQVDRIDGISVAAQMLGLVVLDGQGSPLRPAILWDDTRSVQQSRELLDALGGPDAWASVVGTQPLPGLSVASWAWLRQTEPDLAHSVYGIRLPHDFLTERLTGYGVTDRGDASGTGWWSSHREDYVSEVLELPMVDLDRSLLPRVLAPDTPAGEVTREAASVTGLRAGITVGCGTGDNMAAALALGLGTGVPVVSLGTSGTAYVRSTQPSADPTGQVSADASATGDYLPLSCTLNATLAVDATAKLFDIDRESVSPSTNVVMMPYFSGERLPNYPQARATITGIEYTTTPQQVLLAAYESVAYSLAAAVGLLDSHSSGVDGDAPLFLIGGGARGKVWRETIARFVGRPVIVPKRDELVAWGAAAQAAATLTGEKADDVARRWRVFDGSMEPAREPDREQMAWIARARDAAHTLNAGGTWTI